MCKSVCCTAVFPLYPDSSPSSSNNTLLLPIFQRNLATALCGLFINLVEECWLAYHHYQLLAALLFNNFILPSSSQKALSKESKTFNKKNLKLTRKRERDAFDFGFYLGLRSLSTWQNQNVLFLLIHECNFVHLG